MYLNSIAHYIPETVVPNSYFSDLNGLTDEWITTRTGIKERRKAGKKENTHTMAIASVDLALKNLPFPASEVDLIVGATYSPYDTVATIAHAVQHHLGINHVPAVSISSACSSFLNAVEIVEGYFAMKKAKKALVVVSEHNTAYSNETDPVAGHLWGDGSCAVFISAERVIDTDMHIIDITTGGAGAVGKGVEGVVLRPKNEGIKMPHGRDVFIHACQYMTEVSKQLLEKNGFSVEDISYFIPHQANMRISRNVAGQLNLPEEKIISNIQYLGNTGCAGCAIGLSENKSRFVKDDLLVVSVFGGGYSYGSMLIQV